MILWWQCLLICGLHKRNGARCILLRRLPLYCHSDRVPLGLVCKAQGLEMGAQAIEQCVKGAALLACVLLRLRLRYKAKVGPTGNDCIRHCFPKR